VSDTPRTDAETWQDEMDHVDTDYTFAQSVTVSADFARELERELAEMREQRDRLADALRSIRRRLGDFQEPWNSRETYIDKAAREALEAVKGTNQ
jgi:transposase-like protein